MGLKHYWGQFPGLRERLIEYGEFIAGKVQEFGADTCFYGLVDCEQEGKKAGEYFNENHVDLILAHSATYVTSASVLPLHQICSAPVVILNLQPAAKINYEKTTTGNGWHTAVRARCLSFPMPSTVPKSNTGL